MQAKNGIVMDVIREVWLLIRRDPFEPRLTIYRMYKLIHLLRHRPRPTADEAGFTLLEMLVVIAILGLLITLVAPAALRQLSSARTSVAHQSIARLGSVLDMY